MKKLLFKQFEIPTNTRQSVLEKIKKYILHPRGFFHVVSLNPENIVLARSKRSFKKVLLTAQLALIDGVGIVRAAQILKIVAGERYPGVDLMEDLISLAGRMSLSVLLIGGKGNLAESLAQCYNRSYPKATFMGISGVKNIHKATRQEEDLIRSIVVTRRPRIILVAFGSPDQELWIDKHKQLFKGAVCMGVGGSFDYLSGATKRPNPIIRSLGFEWLARLINQPWRIVRQMRLIIFAWAVIKQLFNETIKPSRVYKTRT